LDIVVDANGSIVEVEMKCGEGLLPISGGLPDQLTLFERIHYLRNDEV
jgi:hypothetical protein